MNNIVTKTTNRNGLDIIMRNEDRTVYAGISVIYVAPNSGALFARNNGSAGVWVSMRHDDEVVMDEMVGTANSQAEAVKMGRAYIRENNLRQQCKKFIEANS